MYIIGEYRPMSSPSAEDRRGAQAIETGRGVQT